MDNIPDIFRELSHEKDQFLKDIRAPIDKNGNHQGKRNSMDFQSKNSPEHPSILFQKTVKNKNKIREKQELDNISIEKKLKESEEFGITIDPVSKSQNSKNNNNNNNKKNKPANPLRRSARITKIHTLKPTTISIQPADIEVKKKDQPQKRRNSYDLSELINDITSSDNNSSDTIFKRLKKKAETIWNNVDSESDQETAQKEVITPDSFSPTISSPNEEDSGVTSQRVDSFEVVADSESRLDSGNHSDVEDGKNTDSNGYILEDDGFVVLENDTVFARDDSILDVNMDQSSNNEDIRPMDFTPSKGQSLKQFIESVPDYLFGVHADIKKSKTNNNNQVYVSKHCVSPNMIVKQCQVYIDRMPQQIIEPSFSILKEKETDSSMIRDFKTFFKTPRDQWAQNKFFISLFERAIKPCVSLGNSSMFPHNQKMLELASANRLVIKSLQQPFLDHVCDGCKKQHRMVTYVLTVLKEDGKEEQGNPMYIGSICGEKLKGVIQLFGILNWIPLIPLNEKYVTNTLACINYYDKLCVLTHDNRYAERLL